MERMPSRPLPFERRPVPEGEFKVPILQQPTPELKPLEEPIVNYIIAPDLEVVGVNTPRLDCCVQKVIDEMGMYIKEYGLQFVVGSDNSPRDVIPYFPKSILFFRSATVHGTDPGILAALEGHIPYYRSLGMKIFYYLDDYLINMNDKAPLKLMNNCDGIIVSTNALKEALLAENINRPIYLLKTHIALNLFNMFTPLEKITRKDKFNVLFSSQGRIGIKQLYRIVERMEQEPERFKDVHLVCLSHEVAQIRSIINRFRSIQKTYLEWMPVELYYRLCAGMDLIIAPGEMGDLDYLMPGEMQKPWLDCKSCHKYTVAGAAGIPCISSPLRDYEEHIRHEETGFIARTDDDWIKYINLMMTDKDLKAKIGKAARVDIEDNWNLYDRTAQMARILRDQEDPINPAALHTASIREYAQGESPEALVYVPVHNGKAFIEECLDSVLSQSYTNQKVVVCDNASDDGTPELVAEKYPNVKLIRLPKYNEKANPGIIQAVKESACKFFMQLGADDKLTPNFWETILPFFFREPSIGIVRIGCWSFSAENPEGEWSKPLPFRRPDQILEENKIIIASPCRREVLGNVTFDDKTLFSDWDLWIQIILNGWKWTTCRKPLYWYRRHPEAWSKRFDSRITGEHYTYMREKWMWALIKHGVQESHMATSNMIVDAKKKMGIIESRIEIVDRPLIEIIKPQIYPKALVHIPVHNGEKYIRECLDSIMGQTYPNQTVVVCDNASTDNTVQIIKEEYPSVNILQTKEFEPFNPGWKMAFEQFEFDFASNLGCDDKLCPNFWETLLPLFTKPEIGFVRIGAYQFSDFNPDGSWWKPPAWHDAKEIFESNKVFNVSPVKRAAWESIKDDWEVKSKFSDWDFWMSLVYKGWQWATYDKPMFWYRRRSDSDTTTLDYSPAGNDFTYLKEKWLKRLKKLGIRQSMIASVEELAKADTEEK